MSVGVLTVKSDFSGLIVKSMIHNDRTRAALEIEIILRFGHLKDTKLQVFGCVAVVVFV